MLMGLRGQLVNRRTQIANSIRGFAAEFGHVVAKGLDKIEVLLLAIEDDKTVPAVAREMFTLLADEFVRVEAQVKKLEKALSAWHKSNELSRRLSAIPSVGPIGASLFAMKTSDAKAFKSARHYAAWIGLTPKDHSTAGKQRLGVITRAGDETLRHVLVNGAMSVIKQAQARPDRADPWLRALLARKPAKLAAVALANKTARIAWKMMATGEVYKPRRVEITETACAA